MVNNVYGGRVLAGEDSEEDDEEVEAYCSQELNFQLDGFGSQSSSVVARFAAPIITAPPGGIEEGEYKESEVEEDSEEAILKLGKEAKVELKEMEEEELDGAEENKIPTARKNEGNQSEDLRDNEELWQLDESVNGIEAMSHAFIDAVRPSLDETIRRIGELKENQQRLLRVLREQNAGMKSIPELDDAAVVLDKLPFYTKKVEAIKQTMQEISISTEKMKRRTESLIVDTQSRQE
ncbi:hypothetical protein PsorP6_018142 [Peronosclerospora sorghi]|uniref:Uncharacterized protein n=1 Tax=Peronosclerospora sorghi TaxID=230839 RepID=A0ACC0WC00_9STRA|nr:hypothetical protein PsorP6_018142 [Peronosclerospora sorghi]